MNTFNVLYYGGLPYPFVVGKLSVTVDQKRHCVVFHQHGCQDIVLKKTNLYDVRTNIIKSRSLGKAIVGYCIGSVINKQYGSLLGTAFGAKRKDESELFIDYSVSGNQTRTITLKPGKQVWDLYAAIYSLTI